MRVVMHVGMPKAGSTAMQEALAAHRTEILESYGIDYWQAADEIFPNHNALFESLNRENWGEAQRRAHEVVDHARQSGASVCLLSSEMFLLLADRPDILRRLSSVFGECAAQVEYLIYLRDLRSFLRSYLTQLFANGTFNVEDDQIAVFYCNLVQSYANSGPSCTIINYERATRGGGVLAELIRHCSGRMCSLPLSKLNVTPARPIAHYALAGIVSRLTAVSNGVHINAREIDELRIAMESMYDGDADVREAIARYEVLLQPALDRYIDTAIAALSSEQIKFLALHS